MVIASHCPAARSSGSYPCVSLALLALGVQPAEWAQFGDYASALHAALVVGEEPVLEALLDAGGSTHRRPFVSCFELTILFSSCTYQSCLRASDISLQRGCAQEIACVIGERRLGSNGACSPLYF
jgi:hypothetical protein